MKRRVIGFPTLLILIALLLAGCGAARTADFGGVQSESAAPAAEPVPAAPVTGGDGALAGVPGAPGLERKVIARANIALVVADTEAAASAISQMVREAGGYVAESSLFKASYGGGQVLRGTLTLRVPGERLDGVLAQLEDLAVDVDSRNVNREDVTDQYTDITARLTNLEATETELRALLAEVREKPNATAEDIIAVHRRLTEIRGEIEQLQGRKNLLDNLIGLATIEVTLIPDVLNRPVVEESWRPAVAARAAVRALVNTLQFLADAAIWIVLYLLPTLLLVLIPAMVFFWLLRRWTRSRHRLRQETAARDGD